MSKGQLKANDLWADIESLHSSERFVGDLPVTSVVIDGSITVVYKPQDVSRLVVASASQRISLLTGIVTRQPGHLPPFPTEVQRRLRSSGLVELPVKAANLAIWQRSS